MLTKQIFEEAAIEVKNNFSTMLPKMIAYKNYIQRAVLEIVTQRELEDIRDSRINQGLIDKLVSLANQEWQLSGDVNSLYCAAMAVGTILKEYEWGIKWVTGDGLYEIAQRIYDA